MSADGDVQGAFPPDTGVRVGKLSGSSVLVSGVPVDCGFIDPDMTEGSPIALLRWQGAWLALGSVRPSKPTTFGFASALSDVVLTTSPQDMPGALVTLTLAAPTVYHAIGMFNITTAVTGATTVVGALFVDGAAVSAEAVMTPATAARSVISQQWSDTLAAGTHTFQLSVRKTAAAATVSAVATNTTLSVRLGA